MTNIASIWTVVKEKRWFQKLCPIKYMTNHPRVSAVVIPCNEDENTSRSSSNFTRPCVYTPNDRFNVRKIVRMFSHELKTLKLPYSSVVRRRVNMGVVKAEIPLCKKEHTKNQKEAFI